jgi:two-component system, LytTR family, sensor kinase
MRTSRVIALALVLGVFFTAQEALMDLARGHSANVPEDVVNGLEIWAVWALLTPLVLAAARRWPLDAKPVIRPLAAHSALALGLAVAHNLITLAVQSVTPAVTRQAPPTMRCEIELPRLTGGFHPVWSASCGALAAFVWGLFIGVLFYGVVVTVYMALRFRSDAATLEAELTRSKLDTLRSQLRPHFLFNALNTISVFITEDRAKAQHMLFRLSTLLRRSLDESAHEVALQQELSYANDYLDIQRGRFGDELIVRVAVDPAVLGARVPVFLLQPLLENVMQHGKAADTVTTVTLCADRERDLLRITLEDDGPGIPAGEPVHEGVGLSNTRQRLLHLYGPRATIDLRPASPGARVSIRIPYESADRRR